MQGSSLLTYIYIYIHTHICVLASCEDILLCEYGLVRENSHGLPDFCEAVRVREQLLITPEP